MAPPLPTQNLLAVSPNPFVGETKLAFVVPAGQENGFVEGGEGLVSSVRAELALHDIKGIAERTLS